MSLNPMRTPGGANIATGRTISMFSGDLTAQNTLMSKRVSGKRILAVGAAGSIGSNTIKTLQHFGPKSLHVIDQNENALAELVRQLRSQPGGLAIADFRTLPLDYGSHATLQFLKAQAAYDIVLNFAAIKHVRSEKDPFSTLQMFDTNILKQDRFLNWLGQTGFSGRYFSVSTDKAANPSSLMGATKRVMEHVMFASDGRKTLGNAIVTSARFANVAFSNGSLLESFVNRMKRDEPLACPIGVTRYFVSLEESGEICALASILAPDGHIAIPRLNPEDHLIPLEKIARAFINNQGFEPRIYEDEEAAIKNLETDKAEGRYPLILTPANTAGEKPYEEFVAEGESVNEIGLNGLRSVSYRKSHGDVGSVVDQIRQLLSGEHSGALETEFLKAIIAKLEPKFLETHVVSQLNLDQRA